MEMCHDVMLAENRPGQVQRRKLAEGNHGNVPRLKASRHGGNVENSDNRTIVITFTLYVIRSWLSGSQSSSSCSRGSI